MPNRAEHYRDMADECRQLATFSVSSELRSRFSEMADRYGALAEAEEPVTRTSTIRQLPQIRPDGWRLAHAAYR